MGLNDPNLGKVEGDCVCWREKLILGKCFEGWLNKARFVTMVLVKMCKFFFESVFVILVDRVDL